MFGLGSSLSLYSGILLLNSIFDKRRGLASGVGSLGAGIGTLIWGLLIPLVERQLGLQGMLQALGGLVLVALLSAAWLLTNPYSPHMDTDQQQARSDVQLRETLTASWHDVIRSPRVRLACAGVFVSALGLCKFSPSPPRFIVDQFFL